VIEVVVIWMERGFDRQAHPVIMAPIGKNGTMTPAIAMLEREGVGFEIHEYERGDELRDFGREAAEALGLPEDQVFKTLLLSIDGERDPVVVVVPVSCQVSLKRAAVAFDAKKAALCDTTVAERITGYVVGGISPLGQRRLLRTVLDESVELFDVIFVSGGRRGLDIGVDPSELRRLLDATVAPITA